MDKPLEPGIALIPETLLVDGAQRRGMLLVLGAGVLWSSGGLGVRLMESADAWQIAFYRSTGLVIVLLLAIALRNRGGIAPAFRRVGGAGLLGGLLLAITFIANISALKQTSVANVVLMLSAAPFIAALLGWLMIRESVRRHTWMAMALSMVGIGVMVGSALSTEGATGILLALLMAGSYAAFTVLIRRSRGIDMLPTVCLGGLFTLPLAAPMINDFSIPLWDLGLCLLLGIFQIGLGLILFTDGSKTVPAAELTLLAMTEVVLAPLWVWWVLAEFPGYWTLVGGLLVIAAVLVQAQGARRKVVAPIC